MSSMYTSTTATYGEGRRSVNRPASAAAASSSSYASHTAASTARAGQSTAASAAPSSSSSPSSSADVSSKAAFKASLSRVQKLFGLAQATQGQQYASSRLAYIPIELLRCTAEERPAANLLQPGRKSYWSTASGQNHELVFKISSPCLLGFVKILNRSVSHLEIYVSMHDVANQYVLIQSDLHSPHNKTIMYPTGFLPCRYLKVKCVRGTPAAMYNVSVVGVLERVVWQEMGPQMGSMIVEHPESLLLPSKPALQTQASLTFPAHQTIKAPAYEPPATIRQVDRR